MGTEHCDTYGHKYIGLRYNILVSNSLIDINNEDW